MNYLSLGHFTYDIRTIWYGCQPRINNLRQRPDLGGGLVTHVACMIGKCGNEGSRSEVPALLEGRRDLLSHLV